MKFLFFPKQDVQLFVSIDFSPSELVSNQAKQFGVEQKIFKWLANQNFCSFRSLLQQVLFSRKLMSFKV